MQKRSIELYNSKMLSTITNPKVSIIIPTYNRANYIIETIESIQRQTYPNREIIIIDDGSDDNTEELISKIKNEKIKFYKVVRAGIVGKLKNIGLQKASGELIAFLDSDDLWESTKLEKQVKALQQYPEAGFCLTGGYNFRTLNEPTDYFFKQKEGIRFDNIFLSCFKSEVHAFTQALMIRKECIEAAGIFKEEKTFSDIDFIIYLAYHFKAILLYEPLVYRRLHESNYINPTWKKSYYEGIDVITEYKNKKMLPASIAKDALYKLYINFGEKYSAQKTPAKATLKFFQAWLNKPFSMVPLKKSLKSVLNYFR